MGRVVTDIPCPDCLGTGRRATARDANGSELARHELSGTKCPACRGTGKAFWKIQRHGGRRSDVQRIVWEGPDETECRERFAALYLKMRQGVINLVRPDGTVEDHRWAPRLRTHW